MLDFRSRANGGISCNARMAFDTSRRGAAVAAPPRANETPPRWPWVTPFALGGGLGSGDGAPESLGVAVGGPSFRSLGLGARARRRSIHLPVVPYG